MYVRRITSLCDKNGKRKDVIPIKKYSDIPKPSGIEKRTFRKTRTGKSIKEKYLTKTKTRLNEWDHKRMYWHLKNKRLFPTSSSDAKHPGQMCVYRG